MSISLPLASASYDMPGYLYFTTMATVAMIVFIIRHKKQGKKFQFSLMTLIIVTLAAGVMLSPNVRKRQTSLTLYCDNHELTITYTVLGWPFGREDPKGCADQAVKTQLEALRKPSPPPPPPTLPPGTEVVEGHGFMNPNPYEWALTPAAIIIANAVTCLSLLFFIAVVIEWFIRRRERNNKRTAEKLTI